LIAFIRIGLTPIGQPLYGSDPITPFLVMHGPWHRHADGLDVMSPIGDNLSLEREGFLLAPIIFRRSSLSCER
jgi:hypothetical protein